MDYSEERRDRLLMSDRQPTNPPIFKRSILKLAFQTCLVSLLFVSTIISLSLAWLLVSSVSCSYDNHSTYGMYWTIAPQFYEETGMTETDHQSG
jgi:hypothetical protein